MKKNRFLILFLIAAMILTGCRAQNSPAGSEESSSNIVSEAETPVPAEKEQTPPLKGTPVQVRPACPPSFGVSLMLPEGWTFEVVQSEDDPTSDLTVSVYPESVNGEGAISVSHMRGFGVCGTGLVQKDILFNGHEAWQGFYDGNSLWSFICLKDPKDCVIINSAENWYADYEKEIEQILHTVEFVWYDSSFVDASTYEGFTLASASLDIDADGIPEDCILKDGPTSGLLTVVFTASRDGSILYCNTFNLSGSIVSLEEKDGSPCLILERYHSGSEPTTEYHKVFVKGKTIVIEGLGEFEGYWGDENWNFDLR